MATRSARPGQRGASGTPSGRAGRGQPGRAGRSRAGSAAAAQPAPGQPPGWVPWTTAALSVAGFAVSVYLTVVHYASGLQLYCSDRGLVNCAKVTTSPQSMVFGVIPVALLGLLFFAGMLALQNPWAWRMRLPAVRLARLASVVVGVGFVAYLVYTELFTIGNICLWCTSVHAITLLLFAVTVIGSSLSTAGVAD